MIVYPNQEQAPLKNTPKSLQARELARLVAETESLGIKMTGQCGVDETNGQPWLQLDLSGMREKDIPQRYRATLIDYLENVLHADRCDIEPGDILTLYGKQQHDAVSYGIASNLRDGVTDYDYSLSELQPGEIFEGFGNAIDLATDGIDLTLPAQEQEFRSLLNDVHTGEAIQAGAVDASMTVEQDLWSSYDKQFQAGEPTLEEQDVRYRDPFAGGF